MRRARFAVSDGGGIDDRASVVDALTFDLRLPESVDDENLATQRVAMFDIAPALLGAVHLMWGIACIIFHPGTMAADTGIAPIVPIIIVLLCDAMAFGAMWFRERLGLSPHTLSRALCAYIGITGALWMSYGLLLNSGHHGADLTFLALSFAAGLGAATIVSVNSPPITVVNALVALIGSLDVVLGEVDR